MKNRITSVRRINATLLVAGAMLAGGALASPSAIAGPVEDIVQGCMADAAGTADSLERWSARCEDGVRDFELAYHECMRDAAGTADSLERWVDHCSADAKAATDED